MTLEQLGDSRRIPIAGIVAVFGIALMFALPSWCSQIAEGRQPTELVGEWEQVGPSLNPGVKLMLSQDGELRTVDSGTILRNDLHWEVYDSDRSSTTTVTSAGITQVEVLEAYLRIANTRESGYYYAAATVFSWPEGGRTTRRMHIDLENAPMAHTDKEIATDLSSEWSSAD